MSDFLFPDNTVLCNFASVERLDLLESALDGCGRWTEAVADEAQQSAKHLPALATLPQAGWLGEPIEITEDADVRKIQQIRRVVFGGTDDRPTQHLGEVETCHVIQTWPEFAGSCWVSDDQQSLRWAQGHGIPTRETLDLMRLLVSAGDITAEEGFDLMQQMKTLGRHPRQPATAADLEYGWQPTSA
ncbi:hypothetical protein G3I43_34565 [Streptomyces anulatus]|uniref:Nucleic acid-binding protein n=1 Tax=Streptomyces anulatus TaxID=1892 RepID=A0A6G3T2N3_STRAQ|nr:hypothetical protein [Streptomyces anulatus]NEB89242.1 hypothetical protein [Streptomyces anulatus]